MCLSLRFRNRDSNYIGRRFPILVYYVISTCEILWDLKGKDSRKCSDLHTLGDALEGRAKVCEDGWVTASSEEARRDSFRSLGGMVAS